VIRPGVTWHPATDRRSMGGEDRKKEREGGSEEKACRNMRRNHTPEKRKNFLLSRMRSEKAWETRSNPWGKGGCMMENDSPWYGFYLSGKNQGGVQKKKKASPEDNASFTMTKCGGGGTEEAACKGGGKKTVLVK